MYVYMHDTVVHYIVVLSVNNIKRKEESRVFCIAKRVNWYDQINSTWHSMKHLIAYVHYGLTYGIHTYVCTYVCTY